MIDNSQNEHIGEYEEQMIVNVRKMSNNELRDAFIKARNINANLTENMITESNLEIQKLLVAEGVYSQELKRRELLEWALASGTKE